MNRHLFHNVARLFVTLIFAILVEYGGNARCDDKNLPSKGTASPPNVVMIISDDQAWTDFGFMGHPVVRTPRLDRLAARSALFPRGYVPTSLCRPSLATLISGLYPHQHGISGNDPPRGTDRKEMLRHVRRIPTLPRMLAQRDYVSFQTGKWWEGNFAEGGFTTGMTHGDPAHGGRHGDVGLKIGREGLQPILNFLDGREGKPFFLWYAPILPHTPHNPPARLLDKYRNPQTPDQVARYYAMCEWFDETCGQLLDELDRRHLTENTLVVFVTDNGWIAPAEVRGRSGPNTPYGPKSKRSPYDGGTRTPILLSWPGRIAPARYETLVSSIDLVPTILAATDLKPTAEMPGVNLLEVAAARGKLERHAIFGEIFEHDVVDIDHPARGLMFRWGIDDHWKVILPTERIASTEKLSPELYDLAADPHEMHNLAMEHPETLARIKAMTDSWWPGR